MVGEHETVFEVCTNPNRSDEDGRTDYLNGRYSIDISDGMVKFYDGSHMSGNLIAAYSIINIISVKKNSRLQKGSKKIF